MDFFALYNELDKLLTYIKKRQKIWALLTSITLPYHHPGQSYGLQIVLVRSDTLFVSPWNAKIIVFTPRKLIFGIQVSFCERQTFISCWKGRLNIQNTLCFFFSFAKTVHWKGPNKSKYICIALKIIVGALKSFLNHLYSFLDIMLEF